MRLDEQLAMAVNPEPMTARGLLVKLLRLDNSRYPAREVSGTLPVVVVGHERLSESDWRRWVRENAIAAYGPAQAERMVQSGVDIKEMLATAPFGRALALSEQRYRMAQARSATTPYYGPRFEALDRMQEVLVVVEKWPSLYNEVVDALSEQVITLEEFVNSVEALPSPKEMRGRQYVTLGDLMGRLVFDPLRV